MGSSRRGKLKNLICVGSFLVASAACFGELGAKSEVSSAPASFNEKIWMKHPGDLVKNWESQVFHLGNSYFGASCYGGIGKEVFAMGEKTFWTKGPGDKETNDFGVIPVEDKSLIQKIKTCTAEGNFKEVDNLMNKVQRTRDGELGALSAVGTLEMIFPDHDKNVTDYTRTLNIRDSRVDVAYKVGETNYSREYFCSYPDRILGIRLKSSQPGKLNFQLAMNLIHKKTVPITQIDTSSGRMTIDGKMDGSHRPYRVNILVQPIDGTMSSKDSSLTINNSSEVVIYYTMATNYKPEAPLYKGTDQAALADGIIASVAKSNFDTLYKKHQKDYQQLYFRTSLTLENPAPSERISLPTNERLAYYISKKEYSDLGLKELAFNFGKYILISASRPGTLPAALQGCWNNRMAAPWNGTYQLDMNVTQTYMYGNALSMPECQEPFLDFIKKMAERGKLFARNYFDCDGWTSFMVTDIWGHAGQVSNQDNRFVSTGWMALILWEQYNFERNEAYLKEIYPILKGASEFYQANLVDYRKSGNLVFAGGVSAEHRTPLGAAVSNFQDLTFIRETFQNTIKAAEILGVDQDFRAKLAATQNQLMPYKIGIWGQFQEWVEDIDDPNCQHRHLSHLLAIQPFSQINVLTMPELAAAAKVTMTYRGDADFQALYGLKGNNAFTPSKCAQEGRHYDRYTSQVWCRAARLCTWLRLRDGEKADKIYNDIFRESTLENMIQYETVYANDPKATPFFLDGTVLSAGYVTEMVLQSHHGALDLLPAMPSTWRSGSLKGIRARGGFTVDVTWKDGKVTNYRIISEKPKTVNVRLNGVLTSVTISDRTADGYCFEHIIRPLRIQR